MDDGYQLLDFGAGRKLERFGAITLDRPSPAAEGIAKAEPAIWEQAQGRYERTTGERGKWQWQVEAPPANWMLKDNPITFELRPTEFGHVGVFPEQSFNWRWIAEQARNAGRPLKVLNLFAYTGGSTLAAAAAGAEVTHVDAARSTVTWARRNAELSGLSAAPVRWIDEDAGIFVRRELKRGRRYDAVILDPPSYGHGAKGQAWQIAGDLPDLLAHCTELTAGQPAFMLLTCHSPGFGPNELAELASQQGWGGRLESSELYLVDPRGRQLPSGAMVRATRH